VDVIIDSMRSIPFCIPPNANSINWTYSPSPEENEGKERVGEEEKGKASYEVVAMGGTFDHLHAGHKILLSMACSIASRKLIVGVSGTFSTVLLLSYSHEERAERLCSREYRRCFVGEETV